MIFGGRLAQIRAMQACNPAMGLVFRRGIYTWRNAPLQAQSDKRAPFPCACFSRGERAAGVGPGGFRYGSTVSAFLKVFTSLDGIYD